MQNDDLFNWRPAQKEVQPHFNGSSYVAEFDHARLTKQIKRVYDCMIGGHWMTLGEIEEITGDPQASISAQLRHLRKARFGSHQINKRRRGAAETGLWEYQLTRP